MNFLVIELVSHLIKDHKEGLNFSPLPTLQEGLLPPLNLRQIDALVPVDILSLLFLFQLSSYILENNTSLILLAKEQGTKSLKTLIISYKYPMRISPLFGKN
ncbi:hypothetical protein Fot_38598 [Forsythia ovata]|uniref:Uncharacterized protein n=1 Tax=Forsythia ovata TaxID=205694 RepID=A0ABD1S290_9LAMI